MYRMPAIFFILYFIAIPAFSQPTITGRVVNAADGQPIPGSSVFINNSSIGVVSDRLGRFELNNIPAGKHELIISSIGYETTVFGFTADQLPLQLKIEMQIKVRELQNVVVEPSVEEGWEKWGRLFTDHFVGNTPNAAACKIKNPKVIRFRFYKKSNRVVAYADEPVILENKALGYRISYQLEDFEVNFKDGSFMYAGYPFFEEMEKNKKKWEKKREKAYYGSMLHFMRSLYQDSLAAEGFELRRMMRIPNAEKERVKKIYFPTAPPRSVKMSGISLSVTRQDTINKDSAGYYEQVLRQKDFTEVYGSALLTADSLLVPGETGFKTLFFTGYLYVTYKKEVEDREYISFQHEKRSPTFQRSYIWSINQAPVTIDENGNYYPPQEIFLMAYWGWQEKMSNMLPIDYRPEQ